MGTTAVATHAIDRRVHKIFALNRGPFPGLLSSKGLGAWNAASKTYFISPWKAGLYQILQILSVTLFEKTPMLQALQSI